MNNWSRDSEWLRQPPHVSSMGRPLRAKFTLVRIKLFTSSQRKALTFEGALVFQMTLANVSWSPPLDNIEYRERTVNVTPGLFKPNLIFLISDLCENKEMIKRR